MECSTENRIEKLFQRKKERLSELKGNDLGFSLPKVKGFLLKTYVVQ